MTLAPLPDGYVLKTIRNLTETYQEPNANLENNLNKPGDCLILPWPDKNLSPNQRIHWAKRAQAVKTARQIGFNLAHLAGWDRDYFRKINLHLIDKNSIEYLTKRYDLMLDFYPPNKRRRDDDNLIASFKPYRDGIASALGMDDFRFRTVATVHQDVIKNGRVKVRLG